MLKNVIIIHSTTILGFTILLPILSFSPTESPNRVIFESIPVIIVIFLPTLAVITITIYSSIKKHFTALDAYCYGITHIL
jgi:hypothetical protein